MTMDAVEKMRLWSRVEKTDPAFTKEFNKGGGFRGTSINATWKRNWGRMMEIKLDGKVKRCYRGRAGS